METIKKVASHPDVPRPSDDELNELAYQVCIAIEKCGASPELTNAVSLASDLRTYLRKPYPTRTVSVPISADGSVREDRQIRI